MLCLVKLIHTKNCPNKEKRKPKCPNCRGPHVANYRGCPGYKDQAFRQHVVQKQGSHASILKQASPPPPINTFNFTVEQIVSLITNVVIQITQPQQVKIQGFLSPKVYPKVGVPQGSNLSPLLFLIYVNDMPNPTHPQTNKSQFTDDAGQWSVSKNIDLAAEYLQRDLDKLARWCTKWRIKLNPEKTKVIIFSKAQTAKRAEPALSLYGDLLSYYPQIKFLGITFDNRMTFTKHFEEILERCNQKFHRLRILVNKKWGPSPSTILQIYKQWVRPIFEYGIASTIIVSETVITKPRRVQNSFIRLALRLPM